MKEGVAMLQKYSGFVRSILQKVTETQIPKLPCVAAEILQRVARGGQFRMFGAGHGHILSEEMMDQCGGFSFVDPYNPQDLFGHPLKAGFVERHYEFGEVFYRMMKLQPGDVLWLISNSGTNGVVVELAKRCRENGIYLIAQTNMKQTRTVSARHPSKKKMYEYADVVIDNCGEDGDAAFLTVNGKRQGPTSNCVGTYLLQALNVCFAAILHEKGCTEEDLINGHYPLEEAGEIEAASAALHTFQKRYFALFDEVVASELPNVDKAAALSVQAVMAGKRNLMFGMVHDHSLIEEIHARAGTIMCNRSMVMENTDIQFYEGTEKAKMYAAIPAYGDALLYSVEPEAGDTFFLVSQSASEPALKQMAKRLKEIGCPMILHTNKAYAAAFADPIEHQVDVVIDNHCPRDQLLLDIGGRKVGYPATSIGCFLNQCYVIKMTQQLYENGIDMPTRISINTDRGLVYTEALNRKYFKDTLIG